MIEDFWPWIELKPDKTTMDIGHGHGQVFRVFLMETIYGIIFKRKMKEIETTHISDSKLVFVTSYKFYKDKSRFIKLGIVKNLENSIHFIYTFPLWESLGRWLDVLLWTASVRYRLTATLQPCSDVLYLSDLRPGSD